MAHGINRILYFDYERYLQQTFSSACSDLKLCYDQIVYSAAILALQRLGILPPEIISMLHTIQHISHIVRTAYGDSNLTYGGDTISDKYRHFMTIICQGNGSSPHIWLIISSVVFSALRYQDFIIHFANSFTTEIAQLARLRYVDNCEMVQSENDVESTY